MTQKLVERHFYIAVLGHYHIVATKTILKLTY